MITIKLQNIDKIKKAFEKAPKVIKGTIITVMPLVAKSVLANIRQEAPRLTGNLQDNGHEAKFSNGGLTLTIQNSNKAPYAPYVNFGTRPHTIRPVKKKALYWPGADHPVKIVHHPGTKANPYFDRAIENSQDNINKIFSDAIDKAIKQI